MGSICGRNDKAESLNIKGKKHAESPGSRSLRASPDARLQTLVQCWKMQPCDILAPLLVLKLVTAAKKKKKKRENGTHGTCGVVARTSGKCSQARPDTYAGLQPNPRASSPLRRLRRSPPILQWFCCHYPRRPPWCRRNLPVCFSPPPQAETICSAVAPREQRGDPRYHRLLHTLTFRAPVLARSHTSGLRQRTSRKPEAPDGSFPVVGK